MAGVIKSGVWQAGRVAGQKSEFNFEDMARRADSYLESVRQQAAEIVAAAKARADQMEQEVAGNAMQAAEAAAEEKLQARLDAELSSLVPAVKSVIDEFRMAKQEWVNHWQTETVGLAIAIAERIIRQELRARPEITEELVREALQLAVGNGQFRLHLHPDDLEALGSFVTQLTSELGEVALTETVSDPQVTRGGCRVVTQFGVIDQSLDAQLQRIEEELSDGVAGKPTNE